jgi:predicted solute-binding protein
MTGLPFVWAFWAGRPSALTPVQIAALAAARDGGVEHSDELATAYCGPDRAALGRAYLKKNIKYRLGDREESGLRTYYELAAKHGVVERALEPVFYDA